MRGLTAKISNSIKTPKQCEWRRLTSLWCVNFENICSSVNSLCCAVRRFFFHDPVFNVSRFSRLCSQTRFTTKRKEIDAKLVYLNFGSDKEAALPLFHTFSGTDINGSFLSQGKKIAGSKVINKASASLGATMKLTNETIARLERFVCLLYEPSTKNENVLGFLLPLPFKTK